MVARAYSASCSSEALLIGMVDHGELVARHAEHAAISSAALTKRVVITPMAGTPCRSAATASCRLHDEQLPQSPTPANTACQFVISSTM